MIFFTSDQHLFHTNIIQFCARPFKDVEYMNDEILRRWNDKVKPHDTEERLSKQPRAPASGAG